MVAAVQVVLAAVAEDGRAIQYACAKLQKDKEVLAVWRGGERDQQSESDSDDW